MSIGGLLLKSIEELNLKPLKLEDKVRNERGIDGIKWYFSYKCLMLL